MGILFLTLQPCTSMRLWHHMFVQLNFGGGRASPYCSHFAHSWINSKVNSNHEIMTHNQKRKNPLPHQDLNCSPLEPKYQCATMSYAVDEQGLPLLGLVINNSVANFPSVRSKKWPSLKFEVLLSCLNAHLYFFAFLCFHPKLHLIFMFMKFTKIKALLSQSSIGNFPIKNSAWRKTVM